MGSIWERHILSLPTSGVLVDPSCACASWQCFHEAQGLRLDSMFSTPWMPEVLCSGERDRIVQEIPWQTIAGRTRHGQIETRIVALMGAAVCSICGSWCVAVVASAFRLEILQRLGGRTPRLKSLSLVEEPPPEALLSFSGRSTS